MAQPVADLLDVAGTTLTGRRADVGRVGEERRRRRLWVLAALLAIPAGGLWYRQLVGRPFDVFRTPSVSVGAFVPYLPFLFFLLLLVGGVAYYRITGRSPHVTYRPEQIDVGLDDVVGIDVVKDEVVRSLNLFLSHATFAREMGGRARHGLLFEGPPGTGKTHTAKAMAAEAGVPFLFATATSFQSSYYGATQRKLRAYFQALRKEANRNGGAIGFIDEFDAIAARRHGLEMRQFPSPVASCTGLMEGVPAGSIANQLGTSELTGPVVNELLVQMQSFDQPTGVQKLAGRLVRLVNQFLPVGRQVHAPAPTKSNILVIAATNRGEGLDPALLRPGRFDRRLSFDVPPKQSRRQLVDYFLVRKAHEAELDDPERRDALAAVTQGYTPVMIEALLDEALIFALRRRASAMNWEDIEKARLSVDVGLGQPVAYTDHERALIATHEAGHAVTAWLVAPERRLEVLSIIKRRSALGLLAHGDREDVYTRSRAELLSLIRIAFGGQVSEELFVGDVSTGPASDLAYATTLAAEMVGAAGMTASLVSFRAVQSGPFDSTNVVGRVLADRDGRRAVESLLAQQKY
ncbi:MAG: AAA family ATPase, partial [Mycobacteriales bacterium]